MLNNGAALDGEFFYIDFVKSGRLYHSSLNSILASQTTGDPTKLTMAQTFEASIVFDHDDDAGTRAIAYSMPELLQSTSKTTENVSDRDLIKAAQSGDRSGFEQLVHRYQNRLFVSIRTSVQCPILAEDIVQEAFLKAFQHLDSFKLQSEFYTWLFRIALNSKFEYFRRAKKTFSIDSVEVESILMKHPEILAAGVAAVPDADWAALDLREEGYARHPVDQIAHAHDRDLDVQIYSVTQPHMEAGREGILLSYLDTVIQGYMIEYGEAGALEFFDTTGGWDTPITYDRDAPIYPRATTLTSSERAFVDANLARVTA